MPIADVHAHLTHPKLAGRIEEILSNAREAGLDLIISNGLNPEDNADVLALAEAHSMVRPALGFYPVDAVLLRMRNEGIEYPGSQPGHDPDEALAWLRLNAHRAFAIGEIGLDGYWVPESLWEEQERVFREALAIAAEHGKAAIIHTRKREARTLEILLEENVERVNWHCFGSKLKLARRIADAGHYMSIPANARRAENFTRMLEKLPREQLLLETDCPYLSPTPGTTNEPANVGGTVTYAAELWECSRERASEIFAENFARFFAAELAS